MNLDNILGPENQRSTKNSVNVKNNLGTQIKSQGQDISTNVGATTLTTTAATNGTV